MNWLIDAIQKDEQRPLFTIAVLVSGVVGGLAVVIAVVYLYRFCLKKRPPVTTTGKPELKREQVRSDAMCHSRPLPLPLDVPDRTQQPVNKDASFGSPTKLSQVFPLMSREPSYVQRSVQDVSRSQKSLLSVVETPSRARSADRLSVNDNPELRRASCDVPRGTGRQLPSTEGLEKQYAERQRRMSTFARSDAIQGMPHLPRKQHSTPLPELTRIYERGHAHSRSWNPGCDEIDVHEPLQYQYERIPPREPQYREPQMFIPTINEPEHEEHNGRQHFHTRQAKSFEVSSGNRRLSQDRRTTSISGTGRGVAFPDSNISAACHSLWAAKGHLEQLHALGISDPSSASTSFDSATDSQCTATGDPQKRAEDAERKRMQYKSLLVQRKILSTAAVSSMDSTNSAESSVPDPIFASSVDSSGSDLEQRRLSLMNRHTALSTPQVARTGRDYSVDEQSDKLFREWSRVDPAYEARRPSRVLQRGITHDVAGIHEFSDRPRYQRQMSVAGSSAPYGDENVLRQ